MSEITGPNKTESEIHSATHSVPALEIRALSYSYGRHRALQDINIALPAGRFAILLGPNGAGKTTLFSLVTHLFGTQSGSISVFGHDMARERSPALSMLGVVFQQRTLDLDLTAAQNLIYHAALHGLSFKDGRRRALEEMARAGLASEFGRKVRQLSGGQMRRIEIARALLHEPKLLLCDEATVGLDIGSRAELMEYVRALVRERRIAILWATHLVDEVRPEDFIVVLHRGRVRWQGISRDIVAEQSAGDLTGALAKLWEGP